MARITLGPVIGKVTETTARVLVEVDRDAEVTCRITGADGNVSTDTRRLRAGRPGVFRCTGLTPGTPHSVAFTGLAASRVGRVMTFPANPSRINIAVASCNNTPARGDTDLWQDLFDRYVATADVPLMLHVGDQVYGDRAFEGALRLLDGKSRPSRSDERRILEMYRQLYRWAWNHPATQAVLANVSNLMIWDDHEIRDDWGSRLADGVAGSPEHTVGTLARRVYREYQRQLWDDFDTDTDPPAGELEHHEHRFGGIGVLFLDQRGARSFDRDPTRPYLGSSQWTALEASLGAGVLADVRALIVVTSVPLVYLGNGTSSVGAHVVDDLRDHWAYGPHRKEQIEMLRRLRVWKQAAPDRELLVVGGDVHIGGHTEIRHDGRPVFRQLITSAITNAAPSLLAYAAVRLLMEQEQDLGHGYSFEHSDFTHRRNFGIVIARVPAAGAAPTLEGSLVRSG